MLKFIASHFTCTRFLMAMGLGVIACLMATSVQSCVWTDARGEPLSPAARVEPDHDKAIIQWDFGKGEPSQIETIRE
jgi:hypothetical protein